MLEHEGLAEVIPQQVLYHQDALGDLIHLSPHRLDKVGV